MTIWFTSDLHLGHTNILKYDQRPFASIEEHDQTLIQNWNSRVQPHDQVYLLGDVSWRRPSITHELLKQLQGTIFLIRGNHDRVLEHASIASRFEWLKDLYVLKTQHPITQKCLEIVLCHYPLRSWYKKHYGSYHLYGHTHGSLPSLGLSLDVGMPAQNYYPISLIEVINSLETLDK